MGSFLAGRLLIRKGYGTHISFGWPPPVPVDLYETFCVWKELRQELKMHNGVAGMLPCE
jgi:hypothetical protein